MGKVTYLVAVLCAITIVGCNMAGTSGDVPTQTYVNSLTAAVSATGDLHGQILFPSEYAQHSIRFGLNEVTFVTHPDGRFSVANIPAGEHVLSVRIKGYEPVALAIQVADGESRNLNPLRLKEARGFVLGRLVQERGGSAAGVEVHLAPEDGLTVTDADGIFQFLGVSAGNHTLAVKDSRFFSGNQHFTLDANERRNLGNIRVYPQTRGEPRTARLTP